MKKLWNRISQHGKLSRVEFIISSLAILASIFLLILDFSGIFFTDPRAID